MTSSPLTLTMRMHAIRNIARLEGHADMSHPRHGRGATFYVDIPHYLIDEDLYAFAEHVEADREATLAMSNIAGRVIWDSGAVSEVTWLEFFFRDANKPISLEMHTCDPWPPLGTRPQEHEVGTLHTSVPRHIADAVDYWQLRPGPMDQIAKRVMAGLAPNEPPAPDDHMATLAALRHGWRNQSVPGQFTLLT